MKQVKALFKKEFFFYFNNPTGSVAAVIFAVMANFLFMKELFLRNSSSLRPFFDLLSWLMIIFIPVITMRIVAEERKTNTIEVLLTLPITESRIIVAKFMALFCFIIVSLSLTFSLPLTLLLLSTVPIAQTIVSYIGALFLSGLFIAIGLFFSTGTKSHIVAFLSSLITLFFLLVLGGEFFSSVISPIFHEKILIFSPSFHYRSFVNGVIDLQSVFYFVSSILLFIFLTIVRLEKRG